MSITVGNIRKMTTADMRCLPLDILDDFLCYENDQELEIDNFIIGELVRGENVSNVYTLIHGFPGDNADGVILKDGNMVAKIGEGCENSNEFTDWYIGLGDSVTEWFEDLETCHI